MGQSNRQKTLKKTNKTKKTNVLRLMWHMGVECARKACQTLVLLVFWFSLEKQIKPIKTNPTIKKPSKKQIKQKNNVLRLMWHMGVECARKACQTFVLLVFCFFLEKQI